FGLESRRHLPGGERRIRGNRFRRCEQNHILTIPPRHAPVVAKSRPEWIKRSKSELFKNSAPIGQGLAVDVPSAPLTGRRRREQDLRRGGSKLPDQVLRMALGQMLGNLEASSQVESIRRNLELGAQIRGTKAIGGKQQRRWLDVISVESDDFLYSIRDECAQPRAAAAADVQHTRRMSQLDHHRHDDSSRRARAVFRIHLVRIKGCQALAHRSSSVLCLSILYRAVQPRVGFDSWPTQSLTRVSGALPLLAKLQRCALTAIGTIPHASA